MPLTSTSQPSDVTLQGQFYQGNHSHRRAAVLRSVGGKILLAAGDEQRSITWPELRVSARIGNTPRYLYFPDDSVFETTDNQGIDALSRQLSKGRLNRLIHRLENHLGLILIAVVITAASTAFAFVYGIPWTARTVAQALPLVVAEQLGESTLATLDTHWLEPSQLSNADQDRLQRAFAPYLSPVNGQQPDIEFRASPLIGANALALPDGTVIVTDDLVRLAQQDEELIAILTHEIGHVAHRHGLQGVVQSSLSFWIVVMMTGDLSAFSDGTIAGPTVLVNLAYSRTMEQEADQYALDTLLERGVDPIHFVNIMTRLVNAHADESEDTSDSAADDGWQEHIGGFLSSHPLPHERIRPFQEASGNRR